MPVLRNSNVPDNVVRANFDVETTVDADMAVNYPDSRKLHGDELQNYTARASGEVKDETKTRDGLDRSVEELYITIFEMQRWIEKIDDEGNEWKTRFENQEEFNNNMGLQILLMTDKIEELKSQVDSGEDIMPECDDYSEAKWKKVSNKLERDFQIIQEEMKDIDWRLDQETKAFFIANEGRKSCNHDLNSVNHEIDGEKRQENPPKTPATAFGSSRTPHHHMVPDNPGRMEGDHRAKSRGRYYNDPYLSSGLAGNQLTPRSRRQDPVELVLSSMPAYLQPQWGNNVGNNSENSRPGQQVRMSQGGRQRDQHNQRDPHNNQRDPHNNQRDPHNNQRGVNDSRHGPKRSTKPTREDLVQRINGPQPIRHDDPRYQQQPKGILKQRRGGDSNGSNNNNNKKENKRPADPFRDHVTGHQLSGPPPKALYTLPPNRNGPRNLPPDQRVIDPRMGPVKKTAAVNKLPKIEPRQSNRRR